MPFLSLSHPVAVPGIYVNTSRLIGHLRSPYSCACLWVSAIIAAVWAVVPPLFDRIKHFSCMRPSRYVQFFWGFLEVHKAIDAILAGMFGEPAPDAALVASFVDWAAHDDVLCRLCGVDVLDALCVSVCLRMCMCDMCVLSFTSRRERRALLCQPAAGHMT